MRVELLKEILLELTEKLYREDCTIEDSLERMDLEKRINRLEEPITMDEYLERSNKL